MKLLVIEDDKRIATAVKRGLEGEGFSVDVVLDGLVTMCSPAYGSTTSTAIQTSSRSTSVGFAARKS